MKLPTKPPNPMALLSTHPEAGGSMKPRPLKPVSTQADKYITVG
jgi:hypothetical protein